MKKRTLRRIATLVLAVVFVASTAAVVKQQMDLRAAERAYEAAAAAALIEVEVETVPEVKEPQKVGLPQLEAFDLSEDNAFLATVDLAALRETNPDVLGWIYVPNSVISYPLMRSHDNEDYLYHTWDGTPNVAGSIFLEQYNRPDFTNFHTLIYGHNMADGSMFGELLKYCYQDVVDNYPHVYIALDDVVLRYEIFSVYTADINSDTYRLYFADDAAKESAIAFYKQQSEVVSDVTPTAEDHILTLSTCAGARQDVRWVLQTVLTGTLPR